MPQYTLVNPEGDNVAHIYVGRPAMLLKYLQDGFTALAGKHVLKGQVDSDDISISTQAMRNMLLNSWSWTISEASPLTNKGEWLAYLKALHQITVDFPPPMEPTWPKVPELKYD